MRKSAQNNFAYLLGGLLLLFVLPPSLRQYFGTTADEDVMRVLLLAGFSLFNIISVWSLYRDRWVFQLGLSLALLNIAIAVSAIFIHSFILELCASVFVILFAVLSCFIAGRHVFSLRDTNANSLIGAICVYLLLGLIWAMVYEVFLMLLPQGAFQGLPFDGKSSQLENILYFSFVTLTTAGYGDITPLNPLIRTLAYFEMITGQFYMAILVSGLVAHFMGVRMAR
jgi:voltage-gated potassium channel